MERKYHRKYVTMILFDYCSQYNIEEASSFLFLMVLLP